MAVVTAGVVIGVCISSRPRIRSYHFNGRVVTGKRLRDTLDLHTVRDTDPDEPTNTSLLLAFERTQAAPQSLRLNDTASANM